MSNVYQLAATLYQQMVAHCQAASPIEACGLVGGPDAYHGTRLFPLTNVNASPTSYLLDGKDILQVLQALDQEDLELNAIYHSHPATQARPSQVDIDQAHMPTLYLILSLSDAEPVLRGYFIHDGDVKEIPVEITETGGASNVK